MDLRQQELELSDARDFVKHGIRDLSEQNECLLLGEEHDRYLQALNSRDVEADHQSLSLALQLRKKQINHVLTCFTELSRAKDGYDAACQALDVASTAENQAKTVLRDAQQQEQQERDALLEAFSRQQAGSQELHFSLEDMLTIKRLISKYCSPADWTEIKNLFDSRFLDQLGQLQDTKNRATLELNSRRKARDEIHRDLTQLESQPEPIPHRRDQIQATRLQLIMRGIPHAAFYEVVDFSSDLKQEQRDLLEAQLADAGILDALVIPQEHQGELQELLLSYPDRFLVPRTPVSDPITSLVPDGDQRFWETVLACLQGLSQSDLEAETALRYDTRTQLRG